MPETSRLCPDCHAAMCGHTVRLLRLDICDSCGGVWFDAGEFGEISRLGSRGVDSVVAEEAPNLTPVDPAPGQNCPVCAVALNRYGFAGSSTIMLSGCPQCAGIYVTHSDLMNLDSRDKRLENAGQGLNADEAAAVGVLDSEAAFDKFKSNLSQYNWNQAMTPVAFS